MKVGPSTPSGRPVEIANARADAKRQDAVRPGAAPGADVRLSDLSSRLADIEAKLASHEPFDTRRVAEIKRAIGEGRFTVNAGVVADKLLANVREMLDGK